MKDRFLKVKGKPNYLRDNESSGIVNIDVKGLQLAKSVKKRLNKRDEEIQELKQQVQHLSQLVEKILNEQNR